MKKQKKEKQKMDIKEKKADAVQEKKLNAERENNEETTADLKKIKKTATSANNSADEKIESESEKKTVSEKENVYGVILAGGTGSRFWPLSRAALPKQFLDLPDCDFHSRQSMLTRTAERLALSLPAGHLVVATGSAYGSLARAALPELAEDHLILEEANRDTAFAMVCALERVLTLAKKEENQHTDKSVVVFVPCDHHIEDTAAFQRDLRVALALAEEGKLVTLGILPTEPRTEYGYLLAGRKTRMRADGYWRKGKKFWEKPSAKRAARLLKEGNLYWNSGIYVGQIGLFARLLTEALAKRCSGQPSLSGLPCGEQLRQIQERLAEAKEGYSFDHLVMESLSPDSFVIVPASFDWDDLGTFPSLEKYWRQEGENHVCGCLTASLNSEGNIVYREGGLVALVDVQDLLVAEADGVLLVMPKKESHHLKKLVRALKKQDLREYL